MNLPEFEIIGLPQYSGSEREGDGVGNGLDFGFLKSHSDACGDGWGNGHSYGDGNGFGNGGYGDKFGDGIGFGYGEWCNCYSAYRV